MVDKLPRIGGQERHAEQIYWAMVDWLSEKDVKPGERIPGEVELAERFAVSRPTMREAIRVLEYSGLVESRRGRNGGLFVGNGAIPQVVGALRTLFIIGDKSRESLREARQIVETGVARLAATRITDEELAKLEESMEQMASYSSVDEVRESNDTFHLTIADASGNDFLRAMMIALNSLLNELVQHKPDEYVTFDLKLQGHREVYAALAKRDPDAAALAMRNHIKTMGENARRVQAERETKIQTEADLLATPAD
ncbi:MAG: FadR/GntR family transcriptional regulator [Chloroflexota bacterium]